MRCRWETSSPSPLLGPLDGAINGPVEGDVGQDLRSGLNGILPSLRKGARVRAAAQLVGAFPAHPRRVGSRFDAAGDGRRFDEQPLPLRRPAARMVARQRTKAGALRPVAGVVVKGDFGVGSWIGLL